MELIVGNYVVLKISKGMLYILSSADIVSKCSVKMLYEGVIVTVEVKMDANWLNPIYIIAFWLSLHQKVSKAKTQNFAISDVEY